MEYSKQSQVEKIRKIHRNPEQLRRILKIPTPTTLEKSQQLRYGKCSIPQCISYGTPDHPLDLHHIIPRSQSIAHRDEFTNHLYICGDFFPKNHHKAIHGEATPGLEDLQKLGFFGSWEANADPAPTRSLDETGPILLQFSQVDSIARSLISTSVEYLLDYAKKRGIISSDITLSDNNVIFLKNYSDSNGISGVASYRK